MPFGRRNNGQQPPTYGQPQPPQYGGWGQPQYPPQPPRQSRRHRHYQTGGYGWNQPPTPPQGGNNGGTPGVIYLVLLVIAIGIVYAFTKGIF